jgi:hypothetical protein
MANAITTKPGLSDMGIIWIGYEGAIGESFFASSSIIFADVIGLVSRLYLSLRRAVRI